MLQQTLVEKCVTVMETLVNTSGCPMPHSPLSPDSPSPRLLWESGDSTLGGQAREQWDLLSRFPGHVHGGPSLALAISFQLGEPGDYVVVNGDGVVWIFLCSGSHTQLTSSEAVTDFLHREILEAMAALHLVFTSLCVLKKAHCRSGGPEAGEAPIPKHKATHSPGSSHDRNSPASMGARWFPLS